MDNLRSEKAIVKSCVSDIHAILSNVLEAHDSIHNLYVRRHLVEKLGPTLETLSRIEGVLETVFPLKQGEKELQALLSLLIQAKLYHRRSPLNDRRVMKLRVLV